MESNATPAGDTSDREVVISRLLDAPRELVFEAWVDPKHVVNWWGPDGFRTTIREVAIRPGGIWRFTMHGPDGVDYLNRIEFIEVKRPERLVYHHYGEGDDQMHFHVTVTFDDQQGKTMLTMRSIFDTAAERNRVVDEYGAIEGGIQHLARLADYLKAM
jgi:uncharacterized protein YndB with AHSA1/START domain